MAVQYYQRILRNYPDLMISGVSLHFRCLQELLRLVQDPRERIDYYKELISRFADAIDPGVDYYFMAKAYEDIGDWEQAIRVYQKFLNYPESGIPGVSPGPRQDPRKGGLLLLRQGVDGGQPRPPGERNTRRPADTQRPQARQVPGRGQLLQHVLVAAGHGRNEELEAPGSFDLGALGAFLQSSRVIADDQLDVYSNSGEAYLRTTNWNYRIPTWYLYFRRVDYPPDPEINGRWEWAGIYLGERF